MVRVRLLATRRLLDQNIATHLSEFVRIAQAGAPPTPEADARAEAAYEQRFTACKNWLHEWRELSRATFQRRDYLILLGLAQRRSAAGSDSETGAAEENEADEIVEDGSD